MARLLQFLIVIAGGVYIIYIMRKLYKKVLKMLEPFIYRHLIECEEIFDDIYRLEVGNKIYKDAYDAINELSSTPIEKRRTQKFKEKCKKFKNNYSIYSRKYKEKNRDSVIDMILKN